ncbi:MAG: FecR domain-containing protein [Bryobacteraceae bacterium]
MTRRFTRHISRQLAAYLDGQLTQPRAQRAEIHLRQCTRCRAEYEQVRLGMQMVEHLPLVEAPDAIWLSVEAALEARPASQTQSLVRWRWAVAATVILALAGAAYWRISQPADAQWEVLRLAGSPSVAGKRIGGTGRVGAGEWIETDASSRATVRVGAIGSVEISPDTRLRVVTAQPGEHRLALARGEIRAKISAPPKLFFVDTAAGTAVDLGCEYALSTDEHGLGLLSVTKGWVLFQWQGIESLVPAGASCRTRPQAGPGIPYFEDAPESLKQAVENFGFEKAGGGLGAILSESRVRDTLTLWHLLSRVEGADRERVFDRMAALTPVPAGVSRELALKLDPQTLEHWREELAWTW